MNYEEKDITYFNSARRDLIELIPNNKNNKILELGPGGGDTLIAIKKMGIAKEVIGIELMQLPESNQLHPDIDRMIFGNIEEIKLDLPENHFDVIVIGDVLEHLIDPWMVVGKLTRHLKRGGIFIASIPNIRHGYFKVFLKGDFSYTQDGLFDRTHLRWFCKKNMIDLLTTKELKVDALYPNFHNTPHLAHVKRKNKLTFGIFEEFLALQYFLIARKY
jgi:2-polyprenyl-3-methyl-5-hydroxy-6-metoxy-1,4-benzoquinol methylase